VWNPCSRIKHSKYLSVRNACDSLIYPRYGQVGGMVVCFKVTVMTGDESKEKRECHACCRNETFRVQNCSADN